MLLASAVTVPLLLATAGCRSSDVFTGPDPLAGRPPLGHDVLTLQAVIAAEENLIALYRTAMTAGSPAAVRSPMLRPLLAQHEQHLVQLRARLVEPPGARGVSGDGQSPRAQGESGAGRPPRASTVDIARLRAAERASAASLVRQLATASPALAQLFASIAASDVTHATALGG